MLSVKRQAQISSDTLTTIMAMHALPSPLRQLELHAVDLDDSDSDVFPPPSPSCASSTDTTSSSSSDGTQHLSNAHARKKQLATAKLELGVQERPLREQHPQQQQPLTSYVIHLRSVARTQHVCITLIIHSPDWCIRLSERTGTRARLPTRSSRSLARASSVFRLRSNSAASSYVGRLV